MWYTTSVRLSILQDRLDKNQIKSLLTFPQENLILSVREHPMLLIFRLIKIFIAGVFLAITSPLISYFFLRSIMLSVEVFLLIIAIFGALLIREIIHWYFHMYLITNRKIAEIRYDPLSSELTNSILLDQLRCTEIDAELRGFISEMFDIGNVTITFDRPTHQETFTLTNIRSPRKTANLLSSSLHTLPKSSQQIWTRSKGHPQYTFLEEQDDRILPN